MTAGYPVGALATVDGSRLRIKGFVGSPDGVSYFEGVKIGDESPETLGSELASDLLQQGGDKVLAALRQSN